MFHNIQDASRLIAVKQLNFIGKVVRREESFFLKQLPNCVCLLRYNIGPEQQRLPYDSNLHAPPGATEKGAESDIPVSEIIGAVVLPVLCFSDKAPLQSNDIYHGAGHQVA